LITTSKSVGNGSLDLTKLSVSGLKAVASSGPLQFIQSGDTPDAQAKFSLSAPSLTAIGDWQITGTSCAPEASTPNIARQGLDRVRQQCRDPWTFQGEGEGGNGTRVLAVGQAALAENQSRTVGMRGRRQDVDDGVYISEPRLTMPPSSVTTVPVV